MRIFVLLLAFAILPGVSTAADLSRKQFESGWAKAEPMYLEGLAKSGLPSLKRPLLPQEERRQAVFENPYTRIGPVGLEFARHADGRVTMTVAALGRLVETREVPSDSWDALMARERAIKDLFPDYKSWVKTMKQIAKSPPSPPSPCHSWFLRIGATGSVGTRFAGFGYCGSDEARWLYLGAYGQIAMSVRPECPLDPSDPFWSVQRCYAPPEPKPN